VKDFPELTDYKDASIEAFLAKVKGKESTYGKLIDKSDTTDLVAKLKCAYPCYTCLDSDPSFCSSCWGVGSSSEKLFFLQKTILTSTCKAKCDDRSTTNGQKIEIKDTAGVVIPTKTYYACTECDTSCYTC
jgi:hypothetical protein